MSVDFTSPATQADLRKTRDLGGREEGWKQVPNVQRQRDGHGHLRRHVLKWQFGSRVDNSTRTAVLFGARTRLFTSVFDREGVICGGTTGSIFRGKCTRFRLCTDDDSEWKLTRPLE